MHELSIAMSLVDAVEEEAARRGGADVHAVHVRIGRLTGIVTEALRSSFTMAAHGTAIAGARLVVDEVRVEARCAACGGPRPVRSLQDFRCPDCAGPLGEVVAGRELMITALELNAGGPRTHAPDTTTAAARTPRSKKEIAP